MFNMSANLKAIENEIKYVRSLPHLLTTVKEEKLNNLFTRKAKLLREKNRGITSKIYSSKDNTLSKFNPNAGCRVFEFKLKNNKNNNKHYIQEKEDVAVAAKKAGVSIAESIKLGNRIQFSQKTEVIIEAVKEKTAIDKVPSKSKIKTKSTPNTPNKGKPTPKRPDMKKKSDYEMCRRKLQSANSERSIDFWVKKGITLEKEIISENAGVLIFKYKVHFGVSIDKKDATNMADKAFHNGGLKVEGITIL